MTDLSTAASSIPSRLGVTARLVDDELILDLWPTDEILQAGVVRASVLAYVIDALCGIAVDGDPQTWTLTTDLSVRMLPVPAPAQVVGSLEVLRRSTRSVMCRADLRHVDGTLIATGAAGFQYVPRRETDPPKPQVSPEMATKMFARRGTIDKPLREAAGVVAVDPAVGITEMLVTPAVANPNGTLQGAMVALLAEAAAEDLCAHRWGCPAIVSDLDVRYLARATSGPVRATCTALDDDPSAPVEVRLVDTSTGTTTSLVYARAVSAASVSGR